MKYTQLWIFTDLFFKAGFLFFVYKELKLNKPIKEETKPNFPIVYSSELSNELLNEDIPEETYINLGNELNNSTTL